MRVPRFWHREFATVKGHDGKPWRLVCWGWSETDETEAAKRATEKVDRLTSSWNAIASRQPRGWYDGNLYLADPPREEILDEISDAGGQVIGTITRNAYGAIILNTDRMLLIDVDDKVRSSFQGCLRSLVSWFLPSTLLTPRKPEFTTEERINATIASDPQRGYRVYRTAAGWRVIMVSDTVDGVDATTLEVLKRFESDPFYVALCKKQQTFRARLTAKPWRCGVQRAPNRFPRTTTNDVNAFEQWETEYTHRAASHKTCELQRGQDTRVAPELQALIDIHDRWCQIDRDLPLA